MKLVSSLAVVISFIVCFSLGQDRTAEHLDIRTATLKAQGEEAIAFLEELAVSPSDLRSAREYVDTISGASGKVHIIAQSTYNSSTRRIEASPFQSVPSFSVGDLIFFQAPPELPNTNVPVRLDVLFSGGAMVPYFILELGFSGVTYGEFIPGVMHQGLVTTSNRIILVNATGEASISRRVVRDITNAELKALDTNYISLIGSPGPNKFIQVSQIAISKTGTDQTTATHPGQQALVLSSQSSTLTDSILSTRTILDQDDYIFASGGTHYGNDTQWLINSLFDSTNLYLYVGYRVGVAPLSDTVGFTDYSDGFTILYQGFFLSEDISSQFTRVPGTFMVGGIEYQFYRSPLYANRVAFGNDTGGSYLSIILGNTAADQGDNYALEIFVPDDTTLSVPLQSRAEVDSVYSQDLNDVLRDSEWIDAKALGEMNLLANKPVQIGLTIAYSYRSETIDDQNIWRGFFDTYIQNVSDVTLTIVLFYTIHDFPF